MSGTKQWYDANKEEIKAKRRARYTNNPALDLGRNTNWRKNNPESCREHTRTTNKSRMKARNEWLAEYKKTLSCTKCGENHPACLDFHHKDPSTKEFSISKMASNSIERLKAEIAKCEVLCANCHRKEHYET